MDGPPIIAQGAVYGLDESVPGAEALTARNVRTGAVRWTKPLPVEHAISPAYHRGFVYVAGYDVVASCPPQEPFCTFTFENTALYSFDALTGAQGPVVPMRTVVAGQLAVTATDAIVPGGVPSFRENAPPTMENIRIHPWSGTPADRVVAVPPQPVGSVPVIDPARRLVITPSMTSGVEALSFDCTEPCTPTWTHPTNGSALVLGSTPDAVVILPAIFAGTHNVEVLDPSTGDLLYAGEAFRPDKAAVRGTRVWVHDDEQLAMYNDCGQDLCPPVWRARAVTDGQPVLGGNLVYVPGQTVNGDHDIEVFRAAGCGQSLCDPLVRVPQPTTGPLAVGNGVVAATDTGAVHVLGIP
jgi:hypothetical protein